MNLDRCNINALWGILHGISIHPLHRHRSDAENIINEVISRECGNDEALLLPEPMPLPNQHRVLRGTPYIIEPWDEYTLANIQGRTPQRLPDAVPPVPWRRTPDGDPSLRPLLGINDELIDYIPAATELAGLDYQRQLILNDLSQGTLDPLTLPFKYRDDPMEIVFDMPENLPFMLNDIDEPDPTLLDSSLWPGLEIYDNRSSMAGYLNDDHYIYQLFTWARITMAQPEFARNYCIIFRGHPQYYQLDTAEELEGEPEPSLDESKLDFSIFLVFE